MTHLYFNGHDVPRSVESLGLSSTELVFVLLVEADKLLVGMACFALFSRAGVVALFEDPPAALLKSKAVPGVFGVLVADPKEEKAPEPSPNAAEAPPVGEDMPTVVRGETLLKGLERPPCELTVPTRLLEKPRDESYESL